MTRNAKVIDRLGLPPQTQLYLTDGRGVEVDADVFGELLKTGNLTINVSAEMSTVDLIGHKVHLGHLSQTFQPVPTHLTQHHHHHRLHFWYPLIQIPQY